MRHLNPFLWSCKSSIFSEKPAESNWNWEINLSPRSNQRKVRKCWFWTTSDMIHLSSPPQRDPHRPIREGLLVVPPVKALHLQDRCVLNQQTESRLEINPLNRELKKNKYQREFISWERLQLRLSSVLKTFGSIIRFWALDSDGILMKQEQLYRWVDVTQNWQHQWRKTRNNRKNTD